MRALILLAHPEPRSFNAHLAAQAAEQLRHDALQVDVVDLYAEGYDPLEAARHHSSRLQPGRFDAQREQRHGAEQGRLPADVQRHLQLLQAADLVILQFPLWWFAPPAILKGWLDRVLVYGPMYNSRLRHEHGAMRGKRALLSVTTGSSARAFAGDGREGVDDEDALAARRVALLVQEAGLGADGDHGAHRVEEVGQQQREDEE